MLELAGLAFAGAAAGLMGAVLGVGGGIFLVPALVLLFALPMRNAVAAGLVAVIATSTAVASVNVEKGVANMRLGIVLELATVAGALGGALVAGLIPARALIGLFGALQAVIAALLWRGPARGTDAPRERPTGALDGEYDDPAIGRRVSYRVERLPLGLGVSFAAGGLSGLLGVGGGVFKVPALHLFCGVPMKAAAATSNFMIGVTAAASAFLYFARGDVRETQTAVVVLGVLAGSAAGTRLARSLVDASVRRAFALLLVLVSFQMLRRASGGG